MSTCWVGLEALKKAIVMGRAVPEGKGFVMFPSTIDPIVVLRLKETTLLLLLREEKAGVELMLEVTV